MKIQSGDEIQNNLPVGWAWTKLGDIITLEYGKALRQDKRDSGGVVCCTDQTA